MVDYQTYHSFHTYADAFKFSQVKRAIFDNAPEEISAATAELSAVDTILLPPGIHGFFLKEKKWGTPLLSPGSISCHDKLTIVVTEPVHLLVDNVGPVNWNKQAFDQLVLPQRIKNMVKSLVLVRKSDSANASVNPGFKGSRSDLIMGKGEGLIMLLHGGPGTGKTLTAGMLLSMLLLTQRLTLS
jgi:hypothetical protein